jgi:hypothetical protein
LKTIRAVAFCSDQQPTKHTMKILLLAMVMIAVSGCENESKQSFPPEEPLSASARIERKLPPEGELTLATEDDRKFVVELAPDTIKAVERYLKPTAEDIVISAARPVGDYLLLWIGFSEVVDGGIDLIWSVEKQECVGTFLGGYRG